MEKKLFQGIRVFSIINLVFVTTGFFYIFSVWSSSILWDVLIEQLIYFFIFAFLMTVTFYKLFFQNLITIIYLSVHEYISNPFYHQELARKAIIDKFINPGNLLNKYNLVGAMGFIEVMPSMLLVVLGLFLFFMYSKRYFNQRNF